MEKRIKNGVTREDIFAYAKKKYNTTPEYLWMRFPDYAVLRRSDNKKWYAIIMDVPKNKLGLSGSERVDILNIKCNPELKELLSGQVGFLPAYHLNRGNWITVLVDGSVEKETVFGLIDQSFGISNGKTKKTIRTEPTSWLVPANPKYYDIEKDFEKSDTILWKQSNSVIVGDIIYLYMASPLSCILFRCIAVEVDIPYEYDDGKIHMQKAMKIKKLHSYEKGKFGIGELKEHGIVSVRGPRSIPFGLLYKLEEY